MNAQKIKTAVTPIIFALTLSRISEAIKTLTKIFFSGYKMYKKIDNAITKGKEKRVDCRNKDKNNNVARVIFKFILQSGYKNRLKF